MSGPDADRRAAERIATSLRAALHLPSEPAGTGAKGVPPGHARLWCDDPELELIALIGDGRWRVLEGYGDVQTIERPGRVALTHFSGYGPMVISGPLLLESDEPDADGGYGASIHEKMNVLERLAGRGKKATPNSPDDEDRTSKPVVRIESDGRLIPHAYPDEKLTWWLTGIEWSEDGESNTYGNPVEEPVVITLTQRVVARSLQQLAESNAERARAGRRRRSGRRVKALRGDTCLTIAFRELGDADRWQEITTLNGIRDPRTVLKPGRDVILP